MNNLLDTKYTSYREYFLDINFEFTIEVLRDELEKALSKNELIRYEAAKFENRGFYDRAEWLRSKYQERREQLLDEYFERRKRMAQFWSR